MQHFISQEIHVGLPFVCVFLYLCKVCCQKKKKKKKKHLYRWMMWNYALHSYYFGLTLPLTGWTHWMPVQFTWSLLLIIIDNTMTSFSLTPLKEREGRRGNERERGRGRESVRMVAWCPYDCLQVIFRCKFWRQPCVCHGRNRWDSESLGDVTQHLHAFKAVSVNGPTCWHGRRNEK